MVEKENGFYPNIVEYNQFQKNNDDNNNINNQYDEDESDEIFSCSDQKNESVFLFLFKIKLILIFKKGKFRKFQIPWLIVNKKWLKNNKNRVIVGFRQWEQSTGFYDLNE